MRKTSLHALWIVLACLLPMRAAAADTPPRRILPMDGAVASIYGPFSYDPSGNITAIGSTPGSYYIYDPMSRVVAAGVQQGTAVQTQSYGYDVYGNRLGVGGAGGGTYTVDTETNHLTSQGAQYDSAGNLTRWYPPGSSSAREYSYDAESMLTQELAPVGSYPEWSTLHLYTANDERYWTYATGANYADVVSHYTIRDAGGKVLRDYVQDANGFSVANDYVYRDGLLLASIKASATHHYSLDHLGTPRIVTDQGGYKLAEHTYYPFGLELTDGSPTDGLLKFTGHERNPDVLSQANGQLDYMHARYYGANLGRFVSVDPMVDDEVNTRDPQRWNRYSYVMGRPVSFVDPDGEVAVAAVGIPVGLVVATGAILWHTYQMNTNAEYRKAAIAITADLLNTLSKQTGNQLSDEFLNWTVDELKAEYIKATGERKRKLQKELKAREQRNKGKARGGKREPKKPKKSEGEKSEGWSDIGADELEMWTESEHEGTFIRSGFDSDFMLNLNAERAMVCSGVGGCPF